VLGSIGTAVYRSEMADSVPGGLDMQSAEAAQSTLGGAVSVAETLPGPLGSELLSAAHNAFTQSLEIVAVVSAVLALITAAAVTVVLRNVEVGGREAEAELSPEQTNEPGVGVTLYESEGC
jgi:MFS transporter, DHA2 family, multidrug resistance protein